MQNQVTSIEQSRRLVELGIPAEKRAVEAFKKYLTDYRGMTPTEKQYNEILNCFIKELNK